MNEVTCIITINYNNSNDTIEMIDSIVKNVENIKIIIIDNNSDVSDLNCIKENLKYPFNYLEYNNKKFIGEIYQNEPIITIIRSDYNGGFSYGNNIGIEYANLNYNFQYFWFLNNDIILKDNALEPLIECSKKHNDKVVLGSTILEYYSSDIIQCAGGVYFNKLTTYSKYNYRLESIDRIDSLCNVDKFDFVLGCAIFVNKDILNQVNGFSTDYFLYFEELDLSQKLKKIDIKQAWVKNSYVLHKGGNSIGSKSVKHKKSYISEYYENKSCLIYLRKFQKNLFWIAVINRYVLKMIKKMLSIDITGIKALNKAYINYFKAEWKDERN